MLTINEVNQVGNGLSRRDLLRVGALGFVSSLTQADVFRLQARAQAKPAHKAVIMICLTGGPSHIDMYDMKPDAPVEFRGEFKPIQTNVPGMQICELMPLQAKIADKFAIIRGLKHLQPFHGVTEIMKGWWERQPPGGQPDFGCVVSRLRRSGSIPPYVNYVDGYAASPGFLGPAYRAFSGGGLGNLRLRDITLDRINDRKALLHSFDQLQRDIDSKREIAGFDAFQTQALELISSGKARDAFDISREPEQVRNKYGPVFKNFLMARRLVEAGVSVVTVEHSPGRQAYPKSSTGVNAQRFDWDTHDHNFHVLRQHLPVFDAGVYALITDIWERGLAEDVTVVMWGDFGRSPRIGAQPKTAQEGGGLYNGRDHWPSAGFVFIAGGGLRMGQVIKDSGPRGERCSSKPYTPQNVMATLYHALGIDPETTTLPDPSGRPRNLLEDTRRIAEL